ncbi:RNA-directed DNA polymerase, eukaryota, reverse transcriptase zinc-binding domain protein, partial [Tanacetum coccineum]
TPLFHSRSPTYKSLNEQQGDDLTSSISMEELKKAVWSSGNDKAPGPDGFTFSLIKRYRDIFKNDVFNHVLEFFSTGFIPSRCNSSYITLIPNVINPMYVGDYHPISLIGIQYKIIAKIMAIRLAKVIDSVKKKKRAMILKVDFEKAFDSLSWEFLDRTMEFMCFPKKSRDWIHACLHSARASILINGSSMLRLRRDKTSNPAEGALFHGLRIGNDCLHLSHLLYADDVMFMGEWSHSNVQNLLMILHYFFMSLGLKINLHKSNIYVIEVTTNDVSSLASDFVIQPYHGGLGIGSLEAFNIALLLKWWWRFVNNGSMLWVRVIKIIYGSHGGIVNDIPRISGSHLWARIVVLIVRLRDKGLINHETLQRMIGDGSSRKFWEDYLGIGFGAGDADKGGYEQAQIHIDEKDNMDHVLFSELCTKTKTWLREKNAPLPVREAFHQVRSKTKRICAGREVFGTTEEHVIYVPPTEPMLLFTSGWLDASIPEWFAMSLRKWAAKNGCPKCRYLAPRLIHEGRCHEESTEVNNYLREAIDPNDDKTYLAPYHAGLFL